MDIPTPPPWPHTPAEATALQQHLRDRISQADAIAPTEVRAVAGVDNGYLRAAAETTACAAAVALRFPNLEQVEARIAWQPVTFPYIPGLLAFRELPAMLAALRQLETEPDVVLVDAHGYAHPRRMGAASLLGLIVDRPTIGCAKSRLVGHYAEPGPDVGDWSPLLDHDETIGAVLRVKAGGKPLFVSVGHKISLPTAIEVALACARGRSIMPEPTRLADARVRAETRRRRESG